MAIWCDDNLCTKSHVLVVVSTAVVVAGWPRWRRSLPQAGKRYDGNERAEVLALTVYDSVSSRMAS